MSEIETKGGVTVTLDADDLNHLLTHGRASVQKEIGPLEVKIKTDAKIRHQIVLEDPHGESEPIAAIDGGDADA